MLHSLLFYRMEGGCVGRSQQRCNFLRFSPCDPPHLQLTVIIIVASLLPILFIVSLVMDLFPSPLLFCYKVAAI